MKNSQIILLSIFLAIICSVAAGILAFVYKATEKDVSKMKQEKIAKALKSILGEFDNNPLESVINIEYNGRKFSLYPAKKNGKVFAYAISSTSPKGYGGKLTVMAQIDVSGKIGTVMVTEQNETPGLGTVATDRKRLKTIAELLSGKRDTSLPPNKVLDSFKGKNCSSAPWKLKKDGGQIDSITGATISSSAILDAMNFAAEAFNSKKSELQTEIAN
ncbi:MAG TPA: RnfABCDGE type electron transport complex subunit G [Victivallales bacterium]|nr:RnfABCDGE type electron transport complex subunit G [Victivallales bacterium]HPO90900.1 RnfABCDGE type electron transport complex subunit G [Victivallales bacterium]HRR27922.1 RnfABCDGE type electron transport complex subunit G [Victivallales bacterium]HRU00375.1 RnfABCDGE type electron transport complex subunit G [Victivallales bacterium]